MNATMKAFGLDKLNECERYVLGHELLESVHAQFAGDASLTEAKRAELERRIAEANADPDGGVSWEVVEAKLDQLLRD